MAASPRVRLKTDADKGVVAMPVLAPHLGYFAHDEHQTFLISEVTNTLLHGKIYPDLLPLLDGHHEVPEIVSSLAGSHSEANVRSVIASLASKGYLVSAEHGMDAGMAAFWTALGVSPRYVEDCLAATPVTLVGAESAIGHHLESLGVRITRDDQGSVLKIVMCEDYLDNGLAHINRQQIATGGAWILVRSGGLQPLFGPVFRPAEKSPCLDCLTYRLRGHQEIHNYLRNVAEGDPVFAPKVAVPAVREAVGSVAAAEIAKWLVLCNEAAIHEQAISIDIADLSLVHHPVLRRPQCRVCGDESLYRPDREPDPVQLRSSPKTVTNSGGTRTVTPEETLARYRHLVGPVGGVVTWLRRTTDAADPWLHVHWAGSNLALKNKSLNVLRLSLRTKSAGKGSTSLQSEASALCEALERYCGAYHGDEIRRRHRFVDFALDGAESAIHPNDVQLFSESQLDEAATINASGHPYNVVPPRLDPEAVIDWTPVWSLTRCCVRYLPTSLLYYGRSEDGRGKTDFVADSNGCAAGNTLEEAIIQGFFELVERDAFAIWWYNQLRMPAVDLASFEDDYLLQACEYYRGLKRDLWVLDVTSDLGIPTFVALSRRTDKQAEDIIYGAGTHFDPHVAVLRAVCELNQFLNWVQGSNTGGAGYTVDDPQCLAWWRHATVENQPYLLPADQVLPKTRSGYAVQATHDLLEDLARCRALVEAKGMEFLVLDQTRPDIGMPVVRVIVPGMRHYWARLAPGRLFDVPVAQGWRHRPMTESEVNTAPVIG